MEVHVLLNALQLPEAYALISLMTLVDLMLEQMIAIQLCLQHPRKNVVSSVSLIMSTRFALDTETAVDSLLMGPIVVACFTRYRMPINADLRIQTALTGHSVHTSVFSKGNHDELPFLSICTSFESWVKV